MSKDELLKVAESMEFRPLPNTYTNTGIEYRLLKRGKKSCIYRSVDNKYFEVFRIKELKPNIIMGNPVPRREKIPGNEEFGTWAWCVRSEDRANAIYEEIESGARDYEIEQTL